MTGPQFVPVLDRVVPEIGEDVEPQCVQRDARVVLVLGGVVHGPSARLQARAASAKSGGLETFDAGYLIETFRQINDRRDWRRDDGSTIQFAALQSLVGKADGEAMVQQALAARNGEPAIEFAAALIAASHKDRRADYVKHAQKARAGAANDPLLTKNLNHISGT